MPRSFRTVDAVAVLMLSSTLTTGSAADDESLPAYAHPEAPVAPTRYDSSLLFPQRNYLDGVDRARLPWRELFHPDGRFVAEPTPLASAPRAKAGAPSVSDTPPGQGDARGVVRGIDTGQGKIKIKHGPIEKLDMPGMTMVFRVEDPSLLERVQEGDEIAFDVEMQGTGFFVTEIYK